MSLKLKDIILEDVQALIRNLTGFEEHQENFIACQQFMLSNLVYHRYLSVDRHAVRRSVEGMIMKFHVHGLVERGQELDSLVKQFVGSVFFKDFETADIEWSLLSLLLHLGVNPTNILDSVENNSLSFTSFNTDDESGIDWVSHLREGEEEFNNWNEVSSDEDEVDHMAIIDEKRLPLSQPALISSPVPCISPIPSKSQECHPLITDESSSSKSSAILNAQNVLKSECWLRDNIQHGWWLKAFVNHKPLSDHPFSQTAQLLNPAKDSGVKTSMLSEHKIVLDIIWFLAVPCDSAVFMKAISDDALSTHFYVRPHVTTPSLIPEVLSSFLNYVCTCADMIKELQTFCEELHKVSDRKEISGTYEAYSCALQYELKLLLEILSQCEQRAHKQNETFTLMILKEELSPLLSSVTSLYHLHKAAVLDWKQNPNWLCAIHLLSVTLLSLRNAEENIGVNVRLFVRTFWVYLEMIDQWLIGGQLYDVRDEFFIVRMDKKKSSLGALFGKRDWEIKMSALGVDPPQALQILEQCLLKAAQPLHVLCEMNRLSELRKHTSSRYSLKHLFLRNLIGYLGVCRHDTVMEAENMSGNEKDLWWKQLDLLLSEEGGPAINAKSQIQTKVHVPIDVKSVMSHLKRLEEPLLVKDFQALFCGSQDISTYGTRREKNESILLDEVLALSHSIMGEAPVESCIERAVLCLAADWDGTAGCLVANILLQERQLLHHMQFAQSVFLLQSYHRLQPFLSHIFKLILLRNNLIWMNTHSLSVLLQDCMDSDQFTFSVTTESRDPSTMNALECIDSMSITYQVEWPLCAIVGEKSQSVYNIITRLLLKIRWGLWLLEDLDISDFKGRDDSGVSRRLLHLRYWLLHVIRGSYNFIAGHVLNGLWLKFQDDFKSTKDMHSIIEVHTKFLENSVRQSLYASQPDPIKTALFQLVVIAENLHSLWSCNLSNISLSKLSNLETCYSECHRFLAASLHSLAEEEGLQCLVVMSDLFNWNLPKENI